MQIESLRDKMAKVEQLQKDVEESKTDILTNENGVKELQQRVAASDNYTGQLQQDIFRMEASVKKLVDSEAQVCTSGYVLQG